MTALVFPRPAIIRPIQWITVYDALKLAMTFPFPMFGINAEITWNATNMPGVFANSAGATNRSRRQWVAAAVLPASNFSYVRLTLQPHTSTSETITVGFGQGGASAPDFDGGQIQLQVAASSSITLTGGGADVVTDVASFSYTSGKDLVMSFETDGSFDHRRATGQGANYNLYSKAATGELLTTTASGYSGSSGQIEVLTKIELGA